jgi:N-carbamoylputrescine amidase
MCYRRSAPDAEQHVSEEREAGTMTMVRAAVIQAHANMPKDDAIDKHVELIAKAAADGAEVTCLQEIFHGPYFCAEQDPKWYGTAEPEDGPLVTRMREVAKSHNMVLVVPWFEEAQTGVYYNSAVVIERDGSIAGKYRKTHIPHVGPCFWEKFYFKPGNLGYPVFDTSVGKVGLIICYDRHFPEIGRALGLKGAELVFNPSATVESLSKYLWELEQPAHAVANGYWIAAINRVGTEEPLSTAKFYGSSYFCDPRGQIVAQASDSEDEVLVHDVDLDMIRDVRNTWQFLRDRRPELYGELTQLLP